MGIYQLPWCDFVVYAYKGLIIIRVPFDTDYFKVLCNKVSAVHRQYYLPVIEKENQSVSEDK